MFEVAFSEVILLGLIGLLVLGPERLPGVARTLGGFVRKARASWISLRKTIEAEMAEADLSAPIKKAREELQQIGKDLTEAPAFTSKTRPSGVIDPMTNPGDVVKPDTATESSDHKSENG